jgi:hypothetical protein
MQGYSAIVTILRALAVLIAAAFWSGAAWACAGHAAPASPAAADVQEPALADTVNGAEAAGFAANAAAAAASEPCASGCCLAPCAAGPGCPLCKTLLQGARDDARPESPKPGISGATMV